MRMLRAIWREPLVHFLVAGALIYLLYGIAGSAVGTDAGHRIVVDRATLLQYLQYQAKAFEPESFAASFDAMGAEERQRLIDSYVREEVLYREAVALGLSEGDYVMRRRLVQKMEYLLEQDPAARPTDAELQQYLDAHLELYRVVPSWTFTHVYVDPANHSGDGGKAEAVQLLATLNRTHAGFNDAPRHTERFPFLQNYVERTGEYIASHFGVDFARDLMGLQVADDRWQGPLRSELGWHLVLLTGHQQGRVPAVQEIRAQLEDDMRRERSAALQEEAVRSLIAGYKVDVEALQAPAP